MPVNLDNPNAVTDDLVIVYYKKGTGVQDPLNGTFLDTGHDWPVQPVRYHAAWPVDPRMVVIAKSNDDEVILDETFHLNPLLYVQNDPLLPGFNPNDEHAFVAGGKVYALRDDLGSELTSEPYVLVQYQNGADEERPWEMLVFKVVEEAPALGLTFDYAAIASKRLMPPEALQILDASGACNAFSDPIGEPVATAENTVTNSPIFRDRLGGLWAYRAGHDGGTEQVQMKYYYPAQENFYFPGALYPAGPPELGSCVPWLDQANGTPGDPMPVTFTIAWPDKTAKMKIGQTLAQTDPWSDKRMTAEALVPAVETAADARAAGQVFLPVLQGQCSVSVAYDQSIASGGDPLVEMFDYAIPKTVELPKLPDTVVIKLAGDYANLVDLPPQLADRLRYNAFKRQLEFRGVYAVIPTGEDLLLPNVLTEREYDYLRNEFETHPDWQAAIDELWANNGRVPVSDAPDAAVPYALALTSAMARSTGFVTLVFGNNENTCTSGGVDMQVIRVACPLYAASINIIYPACVFDEQLTLKYGGDFAGTADDYVF